MTISKRSSVIAIVLAFGVLIGCKKNEPSKEAALPAASTTMQTATPRADDGDLGFERVLASYEGIRAQLAGDQIAEATTGAEALEQAARDGDAKAPEALRPQLGQIAEAAALLKEAPKDDAPAVRRAFGQVSESVVQLISAQPSLQKGRYLFECPMAQGYKKWVQPTARLGNPYMGPKMLECGAAAKWEGT